MQKVMSKIALLMLLLILVNGISNISTGEARSHKSNKSVNAPKPNAPKPNAPKSNVPKPKQIDCSNDEHCNPFGAKISIGCQNSAVCEKKCNDFGGIFVCYVKDGYCKCELESR